MAFTQDYLQMCYEYRTIYRSKTKKIGDWFGNVTTSEMKLINPDSRTDFNDPEWFYIPDLDDLFEFLAIQIRGCQAKELPAESIELVFNSATNWEVQIKLKDSFIFKSVGGKSPHEVMLQLIFQMSPYATTDTDPVKKAKILLLKNKYPGVFREVEMFKDDKQAFQKPKPEKKKPGILADILEAFREVMRMRRTTKK